MKNVRWRAPVWRLIGVLALVAAVTGCDGKPKASSPSSTDSTLPTASTAITSSPTTVTNPTSTTTTTVAAPATSALTTVAPIDTHILVYGDCTDPSLEPTEIVFACADYGEVLTTIRWTSWTAKNAIGIGVLSYKYCAPNCAEGGLRQSDNTTVTLSNPVLDPKGRPVWSQARVDPLPAYLEWVRQPQPLPTRPD